MVFMGMVVRNWKGDNLMYKINVTSTGKYNNVVLGERYCLFKRQAERLVNLFASSECTLKAYKFTRLQAGVYCWKFILEIG